MPRLVFATCALLFNQMLLSQSAITLEYYTAPDSKIDIKVIEVKNNKELKNLNIDSIGYPYLVVRKSILNQMLEITNEQNVVQKQWADQEKYLLNEQNKSQQNEIQLLKSLNEAQARFLELNEQALKNIERSTQTINSQLMLTNDRVKALERQKDRKWILGSSAGVVIGLLVGLLIK